MESALAHSRNEAWLGDVSPVTLTSIAVGLIVVVLVGSMSLFSGPRPAEVPPYSGKRVAVGPPQVDEPEEPPTVSYSPAPVFLSTRQSSPTRSATPTRRATPSARPSSPKPAPSAPNPKPATPRPGELTPLPASQETSLRSTGGGPETFIDFVNARSEPVVVHWLDYDGQRRQYAVLQPTQGYRQQTYVGHPWVVTDSRGTALVCFLPAEQTLRAVIR